jgi:hypothetical protein
MHRVGSSPGGQFEVQIGNQFAISAKNQTSDRRNYAWVSVDLLRPGQTPEKLYNVDGTSRRVSKSDYQSFFPSTK